VSSDSTVSLTFAISEVYLLLTLLFGHLATTITFLHNNVW